MNNTTTFPIPGILGLLFITLKLIGFIAWSWLWVLAPFWLPIAVGFTIGAAYLALIAIIFLVSFFLKK